MQVQHAEMALQSGVPLAHTILSPEQDKELSSELAEMLDGYDQAMEKRWKTERLIEECYNLIPQSQWQGGYADASELISEIIMSVCDQAHARILGQLQSVTPLVRVQGIESALPPADSTKIAEILETWFDRYVRNEIALDRELPLILYPNVKFGTAVVDASWKKGEQAVEWQVIQNQDAVVWPAWETKWQRAEWAGHRTILTIGTLRRIGAELQIPPELLKKVEDTASEDPKEGQGGDTFADLKDGGIDPQPVASQKGYGLVEIYELWGDKIISGGEMPQSVVVLYERKTKTILFSRVNDQRSGRHNTHPVRYKVSTGSAWGQGVGHEAIPSQAQDTMYMNLESDVLKSSCFHVFLTRPGSIADAVWDNPSPGMRIPTEDPANDFKKESLADAAPLEMLSYARNANEQRKINATGLAAVLQGQGDPTLKSGGGTGAIMALVSEAGKKFGQIDRNVRQDLSDLFLHTLELCVQYGEGKPFVDHLAPEDADFLNQFFTALPSGKPISKLLRISIEAPSATNNDEIRKREQLVVYQMVAEHAQTMTTMFAQQILMATNPAAMVPYLLQWAELLATMSQNLLDAHEVSGVKDKVPHLAQFVQPTPEQAQVNMLMQQLQQMQQQLQQVLAIASAPSPGTASSTPRGADPMNAGEGAVS